jgi:hypothetical protein
MPWSGAVKLAAVELTTIISTKRFEIAARIDLCAPSWRALSILGSAASPAIPEIKKHAAEGPFQGRAMIALAVLGTNSIPALVSLCEHTNGEVRVEAAFVLAKLNVGMRGL